MSNTLVLPGKSTLEELARDIDLGVLLEGGEWGYVMTAKGQYTCHAGRGRLIRNGEIGRPLRDVSVAGMILDTLRDIDGLTEEFEMLTMGGMCGKNGQAMHTNGGGPYVRVKELVVGGQERI
jgi:TldD protein